MYIIVYLTGYIYLDGQNGELSPTFSIIECTQIPASCSLDTTVDNQRISVHCVYTVVEKVKCLHLGRVLCDYLLDEAEL